MSRSTTQTDKANKVLKELKILKIQQTTLEKDNNHLLENIKNKDFSFFTPLLASRVLLVNSRNKQNDKLNKRVEVIRQDIVGVTDSLKKAGAQSARNERTINEISSSRSHSNIDVHKLRSQMENISIKLESFKQEQAKSYEILLNEYNLYDNELSALNRRLIYDSSRQKIYTKVKPDMKILRPSTAPNLNTRTQNGISSASGLPQEVTSYQNFLILNGGLSGGWDDFDHSNFIKIYKNSKNLQNPDKFLEICLMNLPGKSIENIKSHRIWYEKFLELLEDKRAAIENWKRIKDFEKNEIVSDGKIRLVDKDLGTEDQQDKFDKMKAQLAKKKELQRRQKEKEDILSWREQKNQQEKLAQKQLEELELKSKESQQRQLKERQEEIKSDLELYKLEKSELKEMENNKKMEEFKKREAEMKRQAAKVIPRIQHKNDQMLAKKLLTKEIKIYEEEAKKTRLERIKKQAPRPKSSRDFSRLTKLTKAAESRLLAEKDSVGATVGARGMPTRNVPSWRAGLNL